MSVRPLFRLIVLFVLGAFSSQTLKAQEMPLSSIQAAPADKVLPGEPRPLFPPRTFGDHVILGIFAGAAITGAGLIISYEHFKRVRGHAPIGGGPAAVMLLGMGISAGGVAGLITGLVRDLE